MDLHGDKGWTYTDPSHWPGHPEWENDKRHFAKSNLKLLEECKVIYKVGGYLGWTDLPKNEREQYQKRFAEIVSQRKQEGQC